jgi:ankyrin repeat protein
MIVQASKRGDVDQLRRWAKRGVRVRSGVPLCEAVLNDEVGAVRCLVKKLGAGVNRSDEDDFKPLYIAAHGGNQDMVKCLVKEFGADVNLGDEECCTPLYIAARMGHIDIARCLVDDLGADVNEACSTPLMAAAQNLHYDIVRYLLKHGAHAEAVGKRTELGTAADDSKRANAPAEETAYLQARTDNANPSCSNAGLKKCERCLQAYFCGNACIRAHWPAHKAECNGTVSKLKAAGETSISSSSPS